VEITEEQGRSLVEFARATIARELDASGSADEALLERISKDAAFQEKRGVFVTLHKKGQLRGCIGSLVATVPIIEGVREHAINAAFNDHRFSPLGIDELDLIDVEVSILSEPQLLEYDDPDQLLDRLRPGVDGVIIKQGGASATFLPQVWKQLPDAGAFLSHLCQKAGLPYDQWHHGDLQVKTYQVQYFAEIKE
jgi:AmmeMemoRadiSam system protein A